MNINDEEIVGLFFDVIKRNRRYSEYHYGNMSRFKGQIHCLFALESAGTLNQKSLSQILQIRPASVSESLLKLEQKGLITRSPSQKDKRETLVSLTKEGIERVQECRKAHARAHCEMLGSLDDQEKQQFYTVLHKIKNHYIRLEEARDE